MKQTALFVLPPCHTTTFHARLECLRMLLHESMSKDPRGKLAAARAELTKLKAIAKEREERAVALNRSVGDLTDVAARLRWVMDQFRPLDQAISTDEHFARPLENPYGIAHLLATASLILHDLGTQLDLSELPAAA